MTSSDQFLMIIWWPLAIYFALLFTMWQIEKRLKKLEAKVSNLTTQTQRASPKADPDRRTRAH